MAVGFWIQRVGDDPLPVKDSIDKADISGSAVQDEYVQFNITKCISTQWMRSHRLSFTRRLR